MPLPGHPTTFRRPVLRCPDSFQSLTTKRSTNNRPLTCTALSEDRTLHVAMQAPQHHNQLIERRTHTWATRNRIDGHLDSAKARILAPPGGVEARGATVTKLLLKSCSRRPPSLDATKQMRYHPGPAARHSAGNGLPSGCMTWSTPSARWKKRMALFWHGILHRVSKGPTTTTMCADMIVKFREKGMGDFRNCWWNGKDPA